MPFDTPKRGGGPDGRPYSTEDIVTVAFFLRFAESDRAYYGGHAASDAFDAMARIIGVPADEFRAVIDSPNTP